MSDEMLTGHSEALSRAMAWKNEHLQYKNEMDYPSATNNRGNVHARERHADGDMVGMSSLPSQGGAHQGAKGGSHAGMNMPSQGGAYMGNMSGDMSAPRHMGGRQHHAEGDMVRDDERESHMYGDMAGNQQQMHMPPQQPMNNIRMQQPQQYRDGGRCEPREHHSWGSFVNGIKKVGNTIGSGVKSAAKTVGRDVSGVANQGVKAVSKLGNQGINYAKKEGSHLVNQGLDYAKKEGSKLGNAAINYGKNQIANGLKTAGKAALQGAATYGPEVAAGALMAKRGGRIDRGERRERREHHRYHDED